MNDTQVRLAHFPFFEALAKTPDESSSDWRTAKAGLLVLRMLDDWAEQGPEVITENVWGVHVVRRTVTLIDAGNPLRGLILNVLDTMREAPDGSPSDVIPQLMAYARGLEFDAKWALAADVYQTIIKRAHPVFDAAAIVGAYMCLGACYRVVANWKEATVAYKAAGSLAGLRGDIESVIRSEIAMAKLSMDRGNFPKAEKILDKAIARADKAELEDIRAVALHDRATVAHHRGQFELAIQLGYEALNGTAEPSERDRVLGDIAASFFDFGLKDAARDAHMIIAATAQEQRTRWVSTINLLERTAPDGNEAAFEQYRRQLSNAPLPASLAAPYYYFVGQGYRAFEHVDAAIQALEQAVSVASEHELNEVLIRAEQSLDELRSGKASVGINASQPQVTVECSSAVADVANAIHEMRAVVGLTG